MDKMVGSSKACKKCGRVYQATREFFGSLSNGNLRGTCRSCMNEHVRNWSENNQESVRRRSNERQARVDRWAPSSDLRQRLFSEQSSLCALCGKPIENLQAGQVEHLTPAVRGGSNQDSNLALAHVGCNREKANKTLGEYIRWRSLVGLPPSTYSSDKLKEAIATGGIAAKVQPSTRVTSARRVAPVEVSWMPGKEPDRKRNMKTDSRQSTKPAKQTGQAYSGRRDTVYRYAGNLPLDDIRPNQGEMQNADNTLSVDNPVHMQPTQSSPPSQIIQPKSPPSTRKEWVATSDIKKSRMSHSLTDSASQDKLLRQVELRHWKTWRWLASAFFFVLLVRNENHINPNYVLSLADCTAFAIGSMMIGFICGGMLAGLSARVTFGSSGRE